MLFRGKQTGTTAHIASARKSIAWLAAGVAIVLAGFSVLSAVVLTEMRHASWDKASDASKNIVTTIEADIARTLESYDLSLQAVIDGLKLPQIQRVEPELRQVILFDRAATAKYLSAIKVIDASGNIIVHSRQIALPENRDRSKRDYFRVHRDNPNLGLHVSEPAQRPDGQYIIGISRQLNNADGSFAGVVVGTMQLAYFHDLFRRLKLGEKSSMGLIREDGMLLMRSPFRLEDIGRDVSKGQVFQRSGFARYGQFEQLSGIDGETRLFTFKRVADFPLQLIVGISVDEIYSDWNVQAAWITAIVLALCGGGIGLALLLARQLKETAEARRALAHQAATDGLTQLSNRRTFDAEMENACRKADAQKNPLSLLMVDADHFKSLNDTHGHQAGDDALKVIAACISACLRSETDLAARYGGEEFAILLPNTSLAEASAIAERIRNRVIEAAATFPHRLPTVSVGIATKPAELALAMADVLRSADAALYEAKRNGRNRVEPMARAA